MVLDYIDEKYKPKNDEFIVEYYLEPEYGTLRELVNSIVGESSIGTWTNLTTMKPDIIKTLKPHAFFIDEKKHIVKIAYPLDLFELGSIPNVLSSIGGNIFGMKRVKYLRLEDIHFPKKFVKSFKGPKHGIAGVRKILNIKKRPLTGTIVKPKVGLNPKEHAKVAYDAWVGGLDFVKDDENLASMRFNNFDKRIKEVFKLKEKAEKETGEKKGYGINITAPFNEMKRRLKLVEDYGNEYVMIDILTLGFSAVQSIIDDTDKIIHGHRAMHGAFTHFPKHGIDMRVIAKLSRLSGVDQLHIGTAVGKMEGKKAEIQELEDEIENDYIQNKDTHNILNQEWYHMKPVFAVNSGGLHPGNVPQLIKYFGNNIIIQAGGGVHGHPKGTKAGARALRQAVDAVMNKMELEDYAKTHKELAGALEKWGYRKVR